jgi:hypothetical protein
MTHMEDIMSIAVDSASERLFGATGLGAKHISLFPGATPDASAAQVAAEINHALDQVEAGMFEQTDAG